jgi:hypothetical protein
MTSLDFSFLPIRIAGHSRVNSSDDSQHAELPVAAGAVLDESWDQTWLGRSGRSRTQEPSVSQSRPFLGCFPGTLSLRRRASNVPLGFISLTENLMMVAMAVWWYRRHLVGGGPVALDLPVAGSGMP